MENLNLIIHVCKDIWCKSVKLALTIIFIIGGEARANKTIFVATNGSDNNPGTLARPVATPKRALAMAAAGDTIYLRAGRYRVNQLLWVEKPNITISSYPGEKAAIVGPTVEAPDSPSSIIVIVANYVTVSDLEIQGGSYYGLKIAADQTPFITGVVIRNCYIHHSGRDCVKTFNADNLLIEDCEISHSGVRDPSNAEGIDSIGSIGVTIRRCYIHETATNGLYLKGGARNGIIESCRIENTNESSGILLGQDTDEQYMRDGTQYEAINCLARNNIIVNTGAAGLGTYSGYNIRFENNTLYNVAKILQAAFFVVTNSRNVPSQQVAFKNNIVVMSSLRPLVYVIDLADQLICDSNIYYNLRGNYEFRREIKSGLGKYNAWKFAEWKQNMKVDARSQIADPLLDPDNFYKPRDGSPAIDRGEALAEVKTDFFGVARPQGVAYDIGAHEQAGKPNAAPPSGTTNQSNEQRFNDSCESLALIIAAMLGIGFLALLFVHSLQQRLRKQRSNSLFATGQC
jgi:hypothetical protein